MSLLIPIIKRGPKGSAVGKVRHISYHRNGIGGLGFFAVEFDLNDRSYPEIKRLHAVVTFDEDQKGAEAFVTTIDVPGQAWRGTDHFGPDLRRICEAAKWPHEVEEAKL